MPEISWQKSSYSGQGDGAECIELAALPGTIHLRESDDPGVVVTTAPAPLKALLLGIKATEFDGTASSSVTQP
jgi:hypothetical protein